MFVSNDVRDSVIKDFIEEFELYPEFLKELDGVPEKLYLDDSGVIRFEKVENCPSIYDETFRDDAARRLGDKFRNDDVYRKSERIRGCSLDYYWEVFWWKWNNYYVGEYIYIYTMEKIMKEFKNSQDLHNYTYSLSGLEVSPDKSSKITTDDKITTIMKKLNNIKIKPLNNIEVRKFLELNHRTPLSFETLVITGGIEISRKSWLCIEQYYLNLNKQQLIFGNFSLFVTLYVLDLSTGRVGSLNFNTTSNESILALNKFLNKLINHEHLEIKAEDERDTCDTLLYNDKLWFDVLQPISARPHSLAGRGLTMPCMVMDDFGYFDDAEDDRRNC